MKEEFRKFYQYGFFPKELPPEFGPYQLDSDVVSDIWDKMDKYCGINKKICSRPTQLSFPKSFSTRRNLHFLNPNHFGRLVYTILTNWSDIQEHINKSDFASPRLSFSKSANKLFNYEPFQKPIFERVKRSAPKKYYLYADIANYYSSIYTHSIDWALNEGEKRSYKEFNNRDYIGVALDQDVRRSQQNQTNGITVGPETSRVISEILLSYIDQKLAEDVPGLTGTRFVDDYHLFLQSRDEIDQVLSTFHKYLSKFDLKLNETKLKVDSLPEVYFDQWTTYFDNTDDLISEEDFPNKKELTRRFSIAFELVKKDPSNASIRYFLRTLEGSSVLKDFDQDILLELMLHSMKLDPKSISRFCVTLQKNGLIDETIHDILEGFEPTLLEQAQFGNSFEVLWILFLFLHAKRKIPDEVVANILSNLDITCIAYLLLCKRNDLVGVGFSEQLKSCLKPVIEISGDPWHSDLWIILYEDNQQSLGLFNIEADEDSIFEYLLSKNVQFISKNTDLSTISTQLNRYEKDIEPKKESTAIEG